jgi:hypothetical protein
MDGFDSVPRFRSSRRRGFRSETHRQELRPAHLRSRRHRTFLDDLKAEPFKAFTFEAREVAVYQLGDFGTAQKLLWVSADPLPPWNKGPAKKSILDFVAKVTTEGGQDFVPVAGWIATFDNDGTL